MAGVLREKPPAHGKQSVSRTEKDLLAQAEQEVMSAQVIDLNRIRERRSRQDAPAPADLEARLANMWPPASEPARKTYTPDWLRLQPFDNFFEHWME